MMRAQRQEENDWDGHSDKPQQHRTHGRLPLIAVVSGRTSMLVEWFRARHERGRTRGMSVSGGKRGLAAHSHRPFSPNAWLCAAPLADPLEPGIQLGQFFGDRLANIAELIDVAIEADVSDREPLAG